MDITQIFKISNLELSLSFVYVLDTDPKAIDGDVITLMKDNTDLERLVREADNLGNTGYDKFEFKVKFLQYGAQFYGDSIEPNNSPNPPPFDRFKIYRTITWEDYIRLGRPEKLSLDLTLSFNDFKRPC